MEALLTAMALWLSANFPLPVSLDHPRIQFVSAAEMIAPLNKYPLQRNDVSASEISSDIVSLYSNQSKTIFLLNGWEGKTPAELSILVHEMVHHLQNVGQLKFACPEEREELAYKAQESWLHLFGHDLEHDFQIGPFHNPCEVQMLLTRRAGHWRVVMDWPTPRRPWNRNSPDFLSSAP